MYDILLPIDVLYFQMCSKAVKKKRLAEREKNVPVSLLGTHGTNAKSSFEDQLGPANVILFQFEQRGLRKHTGTTK